jgi:hypothetical protein
LDTPGSLYPLSSPSRIFIAVGGGGGPEKREEREGSILNNNGSSVKIKTESYIESN